MLRAASHTSQPPPADHISVPLPLFISTCMSGYLLYLKQTPDGQVEVVGVLLEIRQLEVESVLASYLKEHQMARWKLGVC